jgi:hypothetical protein
MEGGNGQDDVQDWVDMSAFSRGQRIALSSFLASDLPSLSTLRASNCNERSRRHTVRVSETEIDLSSSLLSPGFLGIVVTKFGIRDRIPVVQETQVVHIEMGKAGLRVCRVYRVFRRG